MNKRILHLAASHFPRDGEGNICVTPEIIAEFAELIVRECARVVNDTEYPYENESDKNTWDTCCVWSAEKLKEHFGVEE